jgi:hypothetical protein
MVYIHFFLNYLLTAVLLINLLYQSLGVLLNKKHWKGGKLPIVYCKCNSPAYSKLENRFCEHLSHQNTWIKTYKWVAIARATPMHWNRRVRSRMQKGSETHRTRAFCCDKPMQGVYATPTYSWQYFLFFSRHYIVAGKGASCGAFCYLASPLDTI